jgi:hypothetical protein
VQGRGAGSVDFPDLWRSLLVVSSVYVLACRLFELVVLLGRGERSKELEIVVLRHELSQPDVAAEFVAGVLSEAGDAAALASAARRETLDVPAPASRAAADRR